VYTCVPSSSTYVKNTNKFEQNSFDRGKKFSDYRVYPVTDQLEVIFIERNN
jgi:hypothetical protein